MNLLADEGVDKQIVERLRQDGHDVTYIAEVAPSITDDIILARANDSGALLITADKDFGELVYRQRLAHSGVMLLRLAGLLSEQKANIVADVIRQHGSDLMTAFSVVSSGTVRVRRHHGSN